jgi:hypothetical protein
MCQIPISNVDGPGAFLAITALPTSDGVYVEIAVTVVSSAIGKLTWITNDKSARVKEHA